jgi:hypothetical protein
MNKYQIVVRYKFDAPDDAGARHVAQCFLEDIGFDKHMAMEGSDNLTHKLQRFVNGGAPIKVRW